MDTHFILNQHEVTKTHISYFVWLSILISASWEGYKFLTPCRRWSYEIRDISRSIEKFVIPFYFLISSAFIGLVAVDFKIDSKVIIIGIVSLGLYILSYILPAIEHNYKIGYITKWAQVNIETWTATHKFAGFVFKLLSMIVWFMLLGNVSFILLLAVMLFLLLSPILFSKFAIKIVERML